MKVASGLKMRHSFLSESQEMYRCQVRVMPAPQKRHQPVSLPDTRAKLTKGEERLLEGSTTHRNGEMGKPVLGDSKTRLLSLC